MDQFEGLATAVPVEKLSSGARDVTLPAGAILTMGYVITANTVPNGYINPNINGPHKASDYPELAQALGQPYGDVNGYLNLAVAGLSNTQVISTGRRRAQQV